MLRRVIAAALAATMAATTAAASARANCATPSEQRASDVRILQSDFMVAALYCRSGNRINLVDRYNSFVHKFGGELLKQSHALEEYFVRQYADDHLAKFDSFITALANHAAYDAPNTENYCEKRAPMFDAALAAEPAALSRVAVSLGLPRAHGLAPCSMAASGSSTTVASEVALKP